MTPEEEEWRRSIGLPEQVEKVEIKKPRPRWSALNDRAMKCGEYTICKYGIEPNEDFGLFGSGPEMLAHAKTYRELMNKVEELC